MIASLQIFLAKAAGSVPDGWVLTLVSVLVVFGALLILFLSYSLIGRFFTKGERKGADAVKTVAERGEDADEAAAIAAALHLYMNQDGSHDVESGIITILR